MDEYLNDEAEQGAFDRACQSESNKAPSQLRCPQYALPRSPLMRILRPIASRQCAWLVGVGNGLSVFPNAGARQMAHVAIKIGLQVDI